MKIIKVWKDCHCGGRKYHEIKSLRVDEVTDIHIKEINETRFTTAERNLLMGRVSMSRPVCDPETCRRKKDDN